MSPAAAPPSVVSPPPAATPMPQPPQGGPFVLELSHTRRVTVDKFNGKTMVNVREFYSVRA